MIITRPCDHCGETYEAKSPLSKFCTTRCKMRAARAGRSGESATVTQLHPEPVEREGENVSAVRRDLEALGAPDSALAATALTLAARLDASARETGNSVAAISRELRAVMAEVRQSARPKNAISALRDELAEQRARMA